MVNCEFHLHRFLFSTTSIFLSPVIDCDFSLTAIGADFFTFLIPNPLPLGHHLIRGIFLNIHFNDCFCIFQHFPAVFTKMAQVEFFVVLAVTF